MKEGKKRIKQEKRIPLKYIKNNMDICYIFDCEKKKRYISSGGSKGKILRQRNDKEVIVKLPSGIKKVLNSHNLASYGYSSLYSFPLFRSRPSVRTKAKNPHSR